MIHQKLPLARLVLPALVVAASSASAAVITVANGDFETGADPAAASWDRVDGAGTNSPPSNYSESLPDITGRTMQIKSDGGNYIEQGLNVSDLGPVDSASFGDFTISLDYGYRRDAVTNGDHTLRISLWNATEDTELAGSDLLIADPGVGANSLTSTSVNLLYDNTAPSLAGDSLAFRITSVDTDLEVNSWQRTAVIDNVAITAVPEPSIALLGGLGLFGLFGLFRRRR